MNGDAYGAAHRQRAAVPRRRYVSPSSTAVTVVTAVTAVTAVTVVRRAPVMSGRRSRSAFGLAAVLTAAAWSLAPTAGGQWADGADGSAVYSLNGQNVRWPCTSTKNVYASTGRYVAKNVIATRVQVRGDRAFVVTPRFRAGVPFTLSRVDLECPDRCWPALSPYPCWSQNEEGDPDAIQNAVDAYLDPSGTLWVLDTGLANTVEQPVRRSQPRIFAIDIDSGKVVRRIDLSGLVCSASRLNYITADYGDDGRAFVYVSDAATRAVIVWDVAGDRGYRAVLPKAVARDCQRRDVLYIALARRARSRGGDALYVTYLTGDRLYAVNTCDLRRGCAQGRVVDAGAKPDKIVVLGTDGRSTLYFRYRGRGDVYAWDSDGPAAFGADGFRLVRRADDCRLATQVTADPRSGCLWILESNFPDYLSGAVGCLGANVRLQPLVDRRDC